MSDEGMSDAELAQLRKLIATGYGRCKMPDDLAGLIARLDAAERERDALREALQETDDFIERVNLDEQICCSGQDCGCRGSTQRDYLLHNIRAALTANHSAPVVEE